MDADLYWDVFYKEITVPKQGQKTNTASRFTTKPNTFVKGIKKESYVSRLEEDELRLWTRRRGGVRVRERDLRLRTGGVRELDREALRDLVLERGVRDLERVRERDADLLRRRGDLPPVRERERVDRERRENECDRALRERR
ncbi:unnamed protein product [Toxocara canis]|uniref:Uncharacterized protein n=1 Tax=Toxocara canis TaxID=6265 RepID=A0A183UEL6_TOXCA|nr:unnamed protein product [Toxocara canis]